MVSQVTRQCDLEEDAAGRIINKVTRQAFSYRDSCTSRGITIEYSDAARAQAEASVRELLMRVFNLK